MKKSPPRVNYDLIAHLYDEPGRDYDPDPNLVEFLHQRGDPPLSHVRILDMGCGTGKQLCANHRKYPEIEMVGLDLYKGMLQQAIKRCPEIKWIQGDSTNSQLDSESFDYITNQFSYHHIADKWGLMVETYRLLRPNGRLVITNLDPWSMTQWIVYQFFPASRDRDYSDFLPVEKLTAIMKEVGFTNIQIKHQLIPKKENLSKFFKYASQRHRTSQLLALADKDYQEGINIIKDYVKRSGGHSEIPSETCLVWISGDKTR